MGDFIITAQDGKRYKVTGDSAEGAVAALKKMLGGQTGQPDAPKENIIATTKDGGRVIRKADGQLAFASPGYSTTDQDAIARIMEGATPAEESTSSFDRQTIAQHPIAARGAKFVQGVPFAGEYADEVIGATFGPAAMQATRATQSAMDRENPVESTALGIAGGVAGSIPMAMAVGPAVLAQAPAAPLAQAAAGAASGAVAGAVEGAVSGYGAGDDGNRAASAAQRGLIGGALGGIMGGVAPAVAKGAGNLWQRYKGSDVKVIADELGISDAAARVVKKAIEGDDLVAAQAAIDRAGSGGMLADAGPGTQKLLDAAAVYGNKAPGMVRDVVDSRAAASGRAMQGALDATLGTPQGQEALSAGIRAGTAGARQSAYDAAYAAPIDYASNNGKMLESLFSRVPAAAWKRANELMRLEGAQSDQILAQIADDGAVTLSRLPDVRQLDYLTRALNDVADAADGQGKLGGTTAVGRATGNLAKNIRSTLRSAVPEYGKALDTAADAIGQKKATDLGYDLLRAGTRRETVSTALDGASKAEINAAKLGVRSYIDDTLANVRASVTSPDLDINEFRRMTGELRSRSSRDKMTALLGKQEADALYSTLDKEITSLELRAALATNSKTAARQGVNDSVMAETGPGVLNRLAQIDPLHPNKLIVESLTGTSDAALQLRAGGIYDEIANVLLTKKGSDAKMALALIDQARKGQPLTDAQAQLIGRAVGTSVLIGGHQSGTQALAR